MLFYCVNCLFIILCLFFNAYVCSSYILCASALVLLTISLNLFFFFFLFLMVLYFYVSVCVFVCVIICESFSNRFILFFLFAAFHFLLCLFYFVNFICADITLLSPMFVVLVFFSCLLPAMLSLFL